MGLVDISDGVFEQVAPEKDAGTLAAFLMASDGF